MPRVEAIPKNNPERAIPVIFDHALVARTMLEKVWNDETAFHGIELNADDTPSRGQCGVSSLWFARHLATNDVNVHFVEGEIQLPGMAESHVWVEIEDVSQDPLVIDLTSDQYRNPHGSRVHVGRYGDSPIAQYIPHEHLEPFDVDRRKLLARFVILKQRIASLPRRHQLEVR